MNKRNNFINRYCWVFTVLFDHRSYLCWLSLYKGNIISCFQPSVNNNCLVFALLVWKVSKETLSFYCIQGPPFYLFIVVNRTLFRCTGFFLNATWVWSIISQRFVANNYCKLAALIPSCLFLTAGVHCCIVLIYMDT